MEITEVKILSVAEEQLKAYVTIVLDDCFVIRDLKIIRGPKGHFVAMPSKWYKDRSREIVSTISTEARKMLEDKVFAEYEKIIGEPLTRRKLS
jgi:stage V sporulation protein G